MREAASLDLSAALDQRVAQHVRQVQARGAISRSPRSIEFIVALRTSRVRPVKCSLGEVVPRSGVHGHPAFPGWDPQAGSAGRALMRDGVGLERPRRAGWA